MSTHSFSIENTVNPVTGQAFGGKYAGVFSIRRPSLLDKKNIALKDAASMSSEGEVDISLVNPAIRLLTYAFCYVTTIAEQELPEWFDMASMFEPDDEEAVMAVWNEVNKYLNSFRPKASGGDSKQGSD